MRHHIVAGDSLPIYRQIVRQVMDAIAANEVAPGERLASQRELARELVISPLTVKKGYDELERRGYVATIQGRGTFVSQAPPRLTDRQKRKRLEATARRLVSEAELVGLTLEQLMALLREERALLREGRGRARSPA